jgi:pimeloyl-ACP methyl ester carboxylesterase
VAVGPGPGNPVDQAQTIANGAHARAWRATPVHRHDVILAQGLRVDEHTIEVAGTPVFYRSAPVPDGGSIPFYLHGIPTSSDDWSELLERTGGIAPDLVGFGRTGKGAHLDYTLSGEAAFLKTFANHLGIRRLKLVAHDWGAAIGLVFAQDDPGRVERMALVNPVPLLEPFDWPRLATWIRRRAVGELIMGSIPRWLLERWLRSGTTKPDAFPPGRARQVWEQFDQGTQRAILRLFRSSGERDLAAAGKQLERLRMKALIIWGEQDPWLRVELAERYAVRLPQAEVVRIADAGHWPWLERPEVAQRIAEFIGA